MPKVGKKTYSYSKAGLKKAKAEAKKTGRKVVKQSKGKGY